jgi:hypothetical protein
VRVGICIAWLALSAVGAWAAAPARIEARSADLLVVGLAQGDAMTINVSRLLDNSPVHDATVTVAFRGRTYPAIAQVNGSYLVNSPEFMLPGAVAMEFHITFGGAEQTLAGNLQVGGTGDKAADSGSARQMYWWVLNFAVCGAFLLLWARRKKRPDS